MGQSGFRGIIPLTGSLRAAPLDRRRHVLISSASAQKQQANPAPKAGEQRNQRSALYTVGAICNRPRPRRTSIFRFTRYRSGDYKSPLRYLRISPYTPFPRTQSWVLHGFSRGFPLKCTQGADLYRIALYFARNDRIGAHVIHAHCVQIARLSTGFAAHYTHTIAHKNPYNASIPPTYPQFPQSLLRLRLYLYSNYKHIYNTSTRFPRAPLQTPNGHPRTSPTQPATRASVVNGFPREQALARRDRKSFPARNAPGKALRLFSISPRTQPR